MEKVFFVNTYQDYHANGSNRSYWAKFFKSLERVTNEKNKMHLYSSYNENMPIYEYFSESKGRFVRIMQYNPKNEVVESEYYDTSRFYTAWIDTRTLNINEEGESVQIPELVVCLLMTETNINKAKKLIYSWLLNADVKLTLAEIEEIYAEQGTMEAVAYHEG